MLESSTCSELAKMLSKDVFSVHKVMRELHFNKAVEPVRFRRRKYRAAIVYALTTEGLAWVKGLIGGKNAVD